MLKNQVPLARKLNLEQVCFDMPWRDGGADRDRTDDILLAKQALSQLSYSPLRIIIAKTATMAKADAEINGGPG